jgi:hypothetical protein
MADAITKLETPLTGYVGRGIVFHDKRSAGIFAALLRSEEVATASCVLVQTERRGKEWCAAIVDAGTIAGQYGGHTQSAELGIVARQLWRTNYPVAHPMADLWTARTSRVQAWADGSQATAGGSHLVTSLITASCTRHSEETLNVLSIPEASPEKVLAVETFFG